MTEGEATVCGEAIATIAGEAATTGGVGSVAGQRQQSWRVHNDCLWKRCYFLRSKANLGRVIRVDIGGYKNCENSYMSQIRWISKVDAQGG